MGTCFVSLVQLSKRGKSGGFMSFFMLFPSLGKSRKSTSRTLPFGKIVTLEINHRAAWCRTAILLQL